MPRVGCVARGSGAIVRRLAREGRAEANESARGRGVHWARGERTDRWSWIAEGISLVRNPSAGAPGKAGGSAKTSDRAKTSSDSLSVEQTQTASVWVALETTPRDSAQSTAHRLCAPRTNLRVIGASSLPSHRPIASSSRTASGRSAARRALRLFDGRAGPFCTWTATRSTRASAWFSSSSAFTARSRLCALGSGLSRTGFRGGT